MNKHQIKGAVKEVAGKIQKNVGKVTGNGTQQVKGAARELVGKVEKAYGDEQDEKTQTREMRDRDIERHAR
jgi:uncharacterized protein YjbJ (UPF0337 family)